MQLHLVTTSEHEKRRTTEREATMLHGTVVLDRLVKPWYGMANRIVCADSYFASFEAAIHLRDRGLRFIGVVKTATRKYPIQLMKANTIEKRGEWMSFTHDNANGEVGVMALVWTDRERRYFISTASSAAAGASYERVRWLQLPDGT
jgi:hypothetical protein